MPASDCTQDQPTLPPRDPIPVDPTGSFSAANAASNLTGTSPSSAELLGAFPETVAGYEILGVLGRGGMGVVYKARQVKLGRLVALKMILAGAPCRQQDRDRFRTEAEAIARLQHPNIVQVHEVGEHDGKPFFSLEFCSGGSLDRKLNGTPLPAQEAARLLETLARAMQAAHDQSVIHRDLKPANVLLAADGTPKITDFGLAKKLDDVGQTAIGAIMGTPSYMAPEQASGKSKEIGPAADVYALGAILYECLTGRPPFKAATPLDTILQVVSDEPVPPSQLQPKTPRDLETICLKCLHKEAGKRYASAAAAGRRAGAVPAWRADRGAAGGLGGAGLEVGEAPADGSGADAGERAGVAGAAGRRPVVQRPPDGAGQRRRWDRRRPRRRKDLADERARAEAKAKQERRANATAPKSRKSSRRRRPSSRRRRRPGRKPSCGERSGHCTRHSWREPRAPSRTTTRHWRCNCWRSASGTCGAGSIVTCGRA